jgi:hypothetical protein
MKTHELKILPMHLQYIVDGLKTFELRRNDRCFKVGDRLKLRGWIDGRYTGSYYAVTVMSMLENFEGLKDGYCILSIRPTALVNVKK